VQVTLNARRNKFFLKLRQYHNYTSTNSARVESAYTIRRFATAIQIPPPKWPTVYCVGWGVKLYSLTHCNSNACLLYI